MNTPKNDPNTIRSRTILYMMFFFLMVIVASTNLHAATRILSIPFTVIPQSRQSIANQINHSISFNLMHQSDIELVKSTRRFSSSEILEPKFKEKVFQMASAQNCPYVLYGSVNIFGKSLSMNAVLLDRTKRSAIYTSTEILSQVDQIPDWLNTWLFLAMKKISPAKPNNLLQNKNHIHIENINDEIIGMDLADINHDSNNEILLYSPKQIMVVDKKFNTIHTRKSRLGQIVVFARWLDISKKESCLVISETTGSNIVTGLYQWKNNLWHLEHHYAGWFITFLHATNTIIGQQRQYSDYWGDIMQMQGQLFDKLIPHQFDIPIDTNIFDFNVMHVNKQPFFIQYDKMDRLNVFRNNSLLWRSSQVMGGSIHFIEVQTDSGQIDSIERKYIPSRLLVVDLDSDHSDEIIVCENRSTTDRLFENTRWFSEGYVHIMTWTGSEMQIIWTSKKQPGPVTAYAVEKNGHNWRLWIVSVLKQRNIFRKGLSRVTVYDIK